MMKMRKEISKEEFERLYLDGKFEHNIKIELKGVEGNRIDFVIKADIKETEEETTEGEEE